MKVKLQISVLLLTVIAASAQQALATASTHIWAPSTDVQAFGLWHITSDIYLPVKNDAAGNRLPAVTNIGLTVGVLPFKKLNAEIGFDHKSGFGAIDKYPMYGHAKIGIPENAFGEAFPALAAGIFDIGTKKNYTNYDLFYGKLAKTFKVGQTSLGRLSLGYFSGNSKLLFDNKGKKDNSGVFGAWERTLTEVSDKLWFCVEYMGTKSVYGSVNIGASWKFAPNVSILGGYDIYNNSSLVNTATLQVDIDI